MSLEEKSLSHPVLTSGSLRMLLRQVELLRTIDPEIQAQTISLLLNVAMKDPEPIAMQELAERTGTAQSSVSRNCAMLGKYHRRGQAGHGLLDAYEDPMNRRVKLVQLTTKGRRFIQQLKS
tara:strand:+ start:435 stop:797 length:363 start_codon:yes stop_codon:yes gene_type:complete